MLIILFGLPTSGKNFVGRILQEQYHFVFHDGDDDLPPDMRLAIQHKQVATDAMRDQHLQNILGSMAHLHSGTAHLAIAGAFFKERNRRQILAAYPAACFVLVDTTPELRRNWLLRRHNHLADLAYAEKIFQHFETPPHSYVTLINDNGESKIQQQLNMILGRL